MANSPLSVHANLTTVDQVLHTAKVHDSPEQLISVFLNNTTSGELLVTIRRVPNGGSSTSSTDLLTDFPLSGKNQQLVPLGVTLNPLDTLRGLLASGSGINAELNLIQKYQPQRWL